jgi:hypothetical protein
MQLMKIHIPARWAMLSIFAGALVIGLVLWRLFGPVRVAIASDISDLPFTVEAIPPTVWARPGEMVHVQYRIRNNDLTPLEASAVIKVLPAGSAGQMEVFLSQCSGLNTFQNSVTSDYDVYFRVQAAGAVGSSWLTLKHVFTRVNARTP